MSEPVPFVKVEVIRHLLNIGTMRGKDIAREVGVSRSVVSKINHGLRYQCYGEWDMSENEPTTPRNDHPQHLSAPERDGLREVTAAMRRQGAALNVVCPVKWCGAPRFVPCMSSGRITVAAHKQREDKAKASA